LHAIHMRAGLGTLVSQSQVLNSPNSAGLVWWPAMMGEACQAGAAYKMVWLAGGCQATHLGGGACAAGTAQVQACL
jgi:hypothetical protein